MANYKASSGGVRRWVGWGGTGMARLQKLTGERTAHHPPLTWQTVFI